MYKLTFKDHANQETKEVKCFSWKMIPGGHYEANKGCFDKEVINCKQFYLAKVEVL